MVEHANCVFSREAQLQLLPTAYWPFETVTYAVNVLQAVRPNSSTKTQPKIPILFVPPLRCVETLAYGAVLRCSKVLHALTVRAIAGLTVFLGAAKRRAVQQLSFSFMGNQWVALACIYARIDIFFLVGFKLDRKIMGNLFQFFLEFVPVNSVTPNRTRESSTILICECIVNNLFGVKSLKNVLRKKL